MPRLRIYLPEDVARKVRRSLLKGADRLLAERTRSLDPGDLALSTIVKAELAWIPGLRCEEWYRPGRTI